MPELPEVETVARGLEKALAGKRIRRVSATRKKLRIPLPSDLGGIEGKRIKKISRRAKYILMELDGGDVLIVHLGMSGRMVVNPAKKEKHDHMTLTMQDGTIVVFNDARRFGLIALAKQAEIGRHKLFSRLGPEPFSPVFTAEYLRAKLKARKPSVKTVIMDQRVVAGVGNIYASEALFEAGIDPRRESRTIGKNEAKRLAGAIRKVLKNAIAAGGSSLRDYVQTDGELGYFQHKWAVYDKKDRMCARCKKTQIVKIVQGGRASFYCPTCQK